MLVLFSVRNRILGKISQFGQDMLEQTKFLIEIND